ncbi:hypothetical protein KP509_33G067300 [Ceratopteris richardii]|nr:hypothetical protein KP509_33G067300 [Ceratopteris richardii]
MHPNLVSTLKSLICPSNEQELNLCAQESVLEMAAPASICSMPNLCAQENILEIAASATICSMPASDLATPQPSSPYPLSVSTGSTVGFVENPVIVPKIERKQSQHAAIVPIYLIQNRRPYRCSYRDCSKTFKNPQTLKMHLKTHYGGGGSVAVNGGYNRTKLMQPLSTVPQSCKAGKNKKIPSRCPICKRAFVGLYELRRHFGRKHSEGEKAHACRKCGKRFYIEVDLRDHQKQCGEPLVCKCGMKFAFKCNLVAHKKTHPLCQDEHERQKYQQRKQTQKSQISKAQKITLGMQHGQSKDVSFPSNTGSGKGVPPMIEAVCASNEAYRSCDSTPHWSSSSSRIFHPIVKTEYSTCNQWISPPVLGVSRAL